MDRSKDTPKTSGVITTKNVQLLETTTETTTLKSATTATPAAAVVRKNPFTTFSTT